MATVTLEEKRLKALKQQLFGKSDSPITHLNHSSTPNSSTASAVSLESVNLKADMMKIVVLSFLALAIQLSLFFANQSGLLKLFR